jgi:regulator of protease activity HflC (stomatin/prohibitin superfamily)
MKKMMIVMTCLVGMFMVGCKSEVPQGRVGRIKTRDGWNKEILVPGYHACYGWDKMYTMQTTEARATEELNVLVGGKVNLTVSIAVRFSIDIEKTDQIRDTFERVQVNEMKHISNSALYSIYLQPIVQSVPRGVIGEKADIETVVSNRRDILLQIRKEVIERAKETPIKISGVEITNWDWPKSITNAQERLVQIQLQEKEAEARVRARLKEAEGELKVAEAQKLVAMKEAEAIAESNKIIGESLKQNPAYLQWHTVKAMSEAAKGPNNSFILFPYNMPNSGNAIQDFLANGQLKQMLDAE